MNCQVGDSSVRGSAQLPITPRVPISAMKVMINEAPSSEPRIGRKESPRKSKKLSSQVNLPRGPFSLAALLTSALLPDFCVPVAEPPSFISGSAMMSL